MRNRLSLCLIARNEEALLPACLTSVRGVVEEIIVVDTGSSDRTVEIARAFGATVIEEPWADDFAHPRNTALSRATGEWVLQLDADERLGPGAGQALQRALQEDPPFDCALLPLHNASALDAPAAEVIAGRARLGVPAWLPRLLRRTPALRYEGVIHESVLESLARGGLRVRKLPTVPLVHLGAVPELRASQGKSERNQRLLRRRCELEPDSVLPFGYLALELVHEGRLAEAAPVIEQGWPLVTRQPAYRSGLRLAVARGLWQLGRDDWEGLLQTVQTVRAHEGDHPDLEFLRACALEVRGYQASSEAEGRAHFTAAAASYRRCVEHSWPAVADVFIQGATGWSGWSRLGTALVILDDFAGAARAFQRALEARPGLLDARLGLAEVQLGEGHPGEALTTVEPLLQDTPDAWLLAAAAALMLCAPGDARLFFSRVQERGGAPALLARHRRGLHASVQAALSQRPAA